MWSRAPVGHRQLPLHSPRLVESFCSPEFGWPTVSSETLSSEAAKRARLPRRHTESPTLHSDRGTAEVLQHHRSWVPVSPGTSYPGGDSERSVSLGPWLPALKSSSKRSPWHFLREGEGVSSKDISHTFFKRGEGMSSQTTASFPVH